MERVLNILLRSRFGNSAVRRSATPQESTCRSTPSVLRTSEPQCAYSRKQRTNQMHQIKSLLELRVLHVRNSAGVHLRDSAFADLSAHMRKPITNQIHQVLLLLQFRVLRISMRINPLDAQYTRGCADLAESVRMRLEGRCTIRAHRVPEAAQ